MTSQALSNLNVIITRPIHQSTFLKQQVIAHGGKAIIFPMLEIVPIKHELWSQYLQNLNQYDLIIFTSKNAVDFAAPFLSNPLSKIAAIGPSTANALARYELHVDIMPQDQFDSAHLLALPFFNDVNGKKILIFSGQGGLDYLETQLKKRRAQVLKVDVYQRKCPEVKPEMLGNLTQHKPCVIVSTSSEGLQNLLKIMKQYSLDQWLFQIPIIIISDRMKQFALANGFQNHCLIQAENATEDAIIRALINWYLHK